MASERLWVSNIHNSGVGAGAFDAAGRRTRLLAHPAARGAERITSDHSDDFAIVRGEIRHDLAHRQRHHERLVGTLRGGTSGDYDCQKPENLKHGGDLSHRLTHCGSRLHC